MEKRNKSIKVNFIMNMVLQVSSFIFPLISFPYISRILLPEGTGKVNMAVSFVTYFSMLAQLGIPTYGIIKCAKVRDNREELSTTFSEIFALNIISTIISFVILAMLILAIPRLREEKILYFIVSLNVIFATIGIEWLYQSLEEYTFITVRSLISKAVAVAMMFLLVKAKEDYTIYAAILVLSSGLAYIVNLVKSKEYVDLKPAVYTNIIKHLKPTLVFFAVTCTTTIYTNLDNVMLGFMTTDTDVGYYSAAIKIKGVMVSLITAVGAVILPRATYSVGKGDYDGLNNLNRNAIKLVALVSIPVAVYFVIFAEESILLIAGEAYGGSVLPMQIIMPTIILIGFTNILGMEILVPTGREKLVLYSTIVGAIVDVILNALLINKFRASGAAMGTLVAETAVLIYQILVLKKEARDVFSEVKFGKIILGVIIAGLIALLIKKTEIGLFIKLIASAITFFLIYGLINIKEVMGFCGSIGLKKYRKY